LRDVVLIDRLLRAIMSGAATRLRRFMTMDGRYAGNVGAIAGTTLD
jgi:hypothetical protein